MNAKLANLDEMSKGLSMKDSDSCKIFALFAKFKLGLILSRYGLEKECGIKVAILIPSNSTKASLKEASYQLYGISLSRSRLVK